MSVVESLPTLPPASLDFLEKAWDNPGDYYVAYKGELRSDISWAGSNIGRRLLILPDRQPAVPGHMLVATPDAGQTYYDLPEFPQMKLWGAALAVRRHLSEALQPARNVSIQHFGVGIPYPHMHLLPRNEPPDGSGMYDRTRPEATPAQMAAARDNLLRPDIATPEALAAGEFAPLAAELRTLGYVALDIAA